MALPEESPIEAAMRKLLGAGYERNVPKEPMIAYGSEFGAPKDIGAAPLGSATVSEVPAAAPIAAPVAAAPVAAANAPGLTYAQQLRNDLALSGTKGDAAENIINKSLAAGGWNAGTAYDPANTSMNIHPDIAPGTMRVTRYGPYTPLSVTTVRK